MENRSHQESRPSIFGGNILFRALAYRRRPSGLKTRAFRGFAFFFLGRGCGDGGCFRAGDVNVWNEGPDWHYWCVGNVNASLEVSGTVRSLLHGFFCVHCSDGRPSAVTTEACKYIPFAPWRPQRQSAKPTFSAANMWMSLCSHLLMGKNPHERSFFFVKLLHFRHKTRINIKMFVYRLQDRKSVV